MQNNRQNFVDLIIHLLDLEEKLEKTRIHLTSNEYFTLYRAFQIIDIQNTNQIKIDDISILINKPQEQCELIIQYFSEFKDDKLGFVNFMNICLPKSDQKLRTQLTQKLQKNQGSQEEQELMKQHLSILISDELHFLQQMKLYYIDLEGLINYPFKLKELNELISSFGYKIDVDPIFKRLDYDSNGIVTYEDMKHLFSQQQHHQMIQKNIENNNINDNNCKLNWINNKKCPYHSYNKVIRDQIINFKEFENNKEILRQTEYNQIRLLLNLIKEHCQIYQQIEQIIERLNKFNIKQLFELISENNKIDQQILSNKVQEIVGQSFQLDQSDIQQLLIFFGGKEYEQFEQQLKCTKIIRKKIPINLNILKVLFIKLILLLQLSKYLKQQYNKKVLIQNQDVLDEFNVFSQSNVLLMAKKVHLELTLEEVQIFFKRKDLITKHDMIEFLK